MYQMAQQTIKFTIRQDGTVTEEVMGVVWFYLLNVELRSGDEDDK